MKNKFIILFLLVFLSTHPILATSEPAIILNNMAYDSKHPIIFKGTVPYIALETFADLTNSSVAAGMPYTIVAGHTTIKLNPLQTQIELGTTKKSLNAAPLFINEVLYIPLSLLDCLGYAYTFQDNTLTLNSSVPYSQNADDYTGHSFIHSQSNLEILPSYITNMISTSSTSKTLATSLEEKTYLAYMDTAPKQSTYELLTSKLSLSPYNNIEIVFRPLKVINGEPVLSPYEIYPISIDVQKEYLDFLINDTSIQYDNIWATFLPSYSLIDIDLNKTIDTTIMRVLYQYYRDLNNLRDDEFFSPFYEITNTRTNTLRKQVYTSTPLPTDSFSKTITHTYELLIYRVHTTGKLSYVIDVIKK